MTKNTQTKKLKQNIKTEFNFFLNNTNNSENSR